MPHDPRPAAVWLHRFAVVLALATLLLIFVGGLVTSTGSGLAVPDWPLSFGRFFPPMVGGILYEHGHRLVAATVGMLTLALALGVWRTERRPIVRRLALAAVATVVAQGMLGGLTVLLLLPTAVSVAHACLAQAFLCLTVALAVVTDPGWEHAGRARRSDDRRPTLAVLATASAAAVYAQLVLGALVRHTGAGLAIPDFPLAFGRLVPPFDVPGVPIQFAHRLGAVVVTCLVAWTAVRTITTHRGDRRLVVPAITGLALVVLQVGLGALTIWTRKAVLPATLHVAVGAGLLATTLLLALYARRLTGREVRTGAAVFTRAEVPA